MGERGDMGKGCEGVVLGGVERKMKEDRKR